MIKETPIGPLLSRYIEGKLDEEQAKELEEWRAASPRHEEFFRRATSLQAAEEKIARFVYPEEEETRAWQALRRRVTRGKRIVTRRKIARAVAVALLLAAGGAAYYLFPRPSGAAPAVDPFPVASSTLLLPDGSRVDLGDEEALNALALARPGLQADEASLRYTAREEEASEMHVLRVPRGGEYVLTLSDGSTVYLNAGTELTYPAAFSGSRRDVYLKGEAYFNVQADARRPFTVHALPVRVEVTGTSFGVRAYEDEAVIQTILESGRVQMHAGERVVSLVPNTRAVYDRREETMATMPANPAFFLGWKEGRLVYDNAPLETILKDAGRWYSLDVIFRSDAARSLPFSLNMKRHGSVSDVLQLLEETGKVRFERNDHAITVQ
ncbi:MAG: FecR domain-containing protein [Odoribacteraceae bacterium]|jgi:ferric-dicitrate binding protein FerR (iron transport regulator)|nr:FecR domain-containing protein [Odoribacteraceae bacterium]